MALDGGGGTRLQTRGRKPQSRSARGIGRPCLISAATVMHRASRQCSRQKHANNHTTDGDRVQCAPGDSCPPGIQRGARFTELTVTGTRHQTSIYQKNRTGTSRYHDTEPAERCGNCGGQDREPGRRRTPIEEGEWNVRAQSEEPPSDATSERVECEGTVSRAAV